MRVCEFMVEVDVGVARSLIIRGIENGAEDERGRVDLRVDAVVAIGSIIVIEIGRFKQGRRMQAR